MPGVPDVYQGCELGCLALVDPDNRRPVDFARRRAMLADSTTRGRQPGLAGSERAAGDEAGTLLDWRSCWSPRRALRLRREHPDWFAGADDPVLAYDALAARGPAADHAVAFVRGGRAVTVATRLPAGLRDRGGWARHHAGPARPCPLPPPGGRCRRPDGSLAGRPTGAVHWAGACRWPS